MAYYGRWLSESVCFIMDPAGRIDLLADTAKAEVSNLSDLLE